MADSDGLTSEVIHLAKQAEAATPTPVEFARALGEENFHGDEHGKFEVHAKDKNGQPDMRKAKLLREMFQPRVAIETKMAGAIKTPEVEGPRIVRGTSFFTGGWPEFDRDGRVIG